MILLNEKHSLDLVSKLREQYRKTRHHCFFAILNLFLDPATKTTLDNINEVSPSTASRFFANHTNKQYREFATTLNNWQMSILWLVYTNTNRRGRRGDIAIKFDLTSIEKTGEKLPYVFRFNKILGIHIVLMHVHIGDISFPLDFLVYLGKGNTTQVKLALRMLKKLPPKSWPNRTIVLADAGFGTKGFIRGCLRQGFNRLLVGIRGNRRLTTGEKLSEAERGTRVRLHDMREVELTVTSRLLKEKGKYKRYYVVSTFRGTEKWLRRRYRLRWAIEMSQPQHPYKNNLL